MAKGKIMIGNGEMSNLIRMENCLGEEWGIRGTRISTFFKYPGMPHATDMG